MMNCKDLKEHFDDYLDGTLDERLAAQLRQHAGLCDACQQLIERELRLRQSLRDYADSSVPQPDTSYFDRALIAAEHQGLKTQHRHSWITGFGSAVAAGLAIWLLSGVLIDTPTTGSPGSTIPMVTMALEEPHTVNLVFSSTMALDDATLTILLPEGVELVGFAGQREVTWMTSLKEGKNLLPLRLIATVPTTGELLATLRHGDDDRTFRLRVNVS